MRGACGTAVWVLLCILLATVQLASGRPRRHTHSRWRNQELEDAEKEAASAREGPEGDQGSARTAPAGDGSMHMFMDGAQADLLQRMERTLQEAIGGHARVQARAKWLTGKPEGRAKEHIFWNDNTGAWQDTDPGSAPCLGDHGETWWEIALDKHGTIRQNVDSLGQRYAWVEVWDDRRHRPFYQHRRMHYSSIDRPVDLAWRRVNMEDVSNVEDADMPYSPFGISM